MKKVAIVDYGVGNLFSLASSLKYLGIDSIVTRERNYLLDAEKIILPGVGAFRAAMQKLEDTGLVSTLNEEVKSGKPILGICLGMQMFFECGFEYGECKGLGYLEGKIYAIEDDLREMGSTLKVPHMGWNALDIKMPEHPIVKNIKSGDHVYFVHSFYAKECDKSVVASCDYGVEIPAIVAQGNICGCQFHPEKSGKTGLAILSAFADM